MYQEHFGLREVPFSLLPDTSFFYHSPAHQQVLNVLLVALKSGEGFVKVTGEVGTGKTTLCRKLLDALRNDFITAYLPNPLVAPDELYRALADELGLSLPPEDSLNQQLAVLNQHLIELASSGRKVVLVIDEVQAMPDQTLEALRLLSNLETEKSKLLQIVLFGQPELDTRLQSHGLRQLRQRLAFTAALEPLDQRGLEAYVNHRLKVAGYTGPSPFAPKALKVIWRSSQGTPRLVNILCHKAMLAAFGKGRTVVDGKLARAAVEDTESAVSGKVPGKTLLYFFAAAALLVQLAGIAWYLGGRL